MRAEQEKIQKNASEFTSVGVKRGLVPLPMRSPRKEIINSKILLSYQNICRKMKTIDMFQTVLRNYPSVPISASKIKFFQSPKAFEEQRKFSSLAKLFEHFTDLLPQFLQQHKTSGKLENLQKYQNFYIFRRYLHKTVD